MTEAIRISGVTKRYPRSWRRPPFDALFPLDLTVGEGEVFGFIGPNGAGKSTTIKILTGVLQPTTGGAWLFGKSVSIPAARKGMGYVPENPSLYDFLSPTEFLAMGQVLHGLPRCEIQRNTSLWLERFGLSAVAGRRIRTFSKGMVQRVALAHALAIRPRLLILDEPLSGLDPVGRRDVVDILDEYREQGGAIFLTSHVLHDVERLADRFGLLHKGRLLTVQRKSDLFSSEQRLTVRSEGACPIPGSKPDGKGRWQMQCSQIELWSVLDALRSNGQIVLEVKRAMALEDVFFRFVDDAAEIGGIATPLAAD